MLLQQLINNQQQAYTEIQVQIEQLQEQQRQIQAHLQQLGAVESQMLSAVQMMQEAISSINQHCPSEMESYKNLVNGLFGATPIAQLEGTKPVEEVEEIDIFEIVEEEEPIPPVELDILGCIKDTVVCLSYQELKDLLATYNLNTKGKTFNLRERFIQHCEGLDLFQQQEVLEVLRKAAPTAA